MAEGLFDGRYRYDYIYPRGRSGETLRAYDTHNDERPVVIKRPAPNDAPPIRAGQEVSILNERDALQTLTGHAVLTELLDEGTFMVGGTQHRYIVMERGVGAIIEEDVLALAERSERLPLLETLVIVDNLLDLLTTAHHHDIVYNDVDSKHLFWDRDRYQLKVIDWGNAVLLEGEPVSAQGVSKASDVFQTGELLYFILTGGGRAEVPRDADTAFMVDFGEDAEHIAPELAQVISRALHPNPRLRYPTIDALRQALTSIRKPLESNRNQVIARVSESLRRERSKDELNDLTRVLAPALAMDPGYPVANEVQEEIEHRLEDLEVSADLDAVRIYLDSQNWRGAADILGELKGRSRGEMLQLVRLLFDWSMFLLERDVHEPTTAVSEAIDLVFDRKWETAAHNLILAESEHVDVQRLHMRLAERVTSHMPEVVLLRPNLYRLGEALATLNGTDGVHLDEQRVLLDEINVMLDNMLTAEGEISLTDLRDTYRGVVDRLSAMTTLMEAVNIGWGERRLPLSSLERARNAAMSLADNMHVIGKQAAAAPSEALAALDSSRAIDPANPAWEAIAELLNMLYRLLESYQTYVPVADASDLAGWLRQTQQQLSPFAERLFDEMLVGMLSGLKIAAEHWQDYDNRTIAGNRVGTLKLLTEASQAVGTISPTLSGWFNQLRVVVGGADYVERHALSGGLGRALADGWNAFDRGNLVDAERLAQQADQIARTELHKAVVKRFKTLTEVLRGWTERKGYLSVERTEAAADAIKGLYTPEENTVRERFTKQMPTHEAYLKAMGKGLVEVYNLHSTAAQRILFVDYVLQGAIDAHDSVFDDTAFWIEAAQRTLEPHGASHVAIATLRELIQRRQDLMALSEQFNTLNGVHVFAALEDTRHELAEHPRAKLIGEAIRSLRELENALPDWSNAEFRSAGMKIENAIKATQEAEKVADFNLTTYREWLLSLASTAADLHTIKRRLLDAVDEKPDMPDDLLRVLHHQMVDKTTDAIGTDYTSTLALWNDTYLAYARIMGDQNMRRSAKLSGFNDLFRAMFIDRHPAYPIYRHWFDLTERSPEFPPPPTDEPEPRLADPADTTGEPEFTYDEGGAIDFSTSRYADPETDAAGGTRRKPGRLTLIVAVLAGLALIAAGGLTINQFIGGDNNAVAVTISPTATVNTTGTAVAAIRASATVIAAQANDDDTPAATDANAAATFTPRPTETEAAAANITMVPVTVIDGSPLPTDTRDATNPPPTATDTLTPTTPPTATDTPTATATPTATFTPSVTPTATATATPDVPVGGVRGEFDLLALLDRLPNENPDTVFWNDTRLIREGDVWRMGTGEDTPEAGWVLVPPLTVFDTYLGENAAARLTSMEATLALVTFNPALLESERLYLGGMFVPAAGDDPLNRGAGLNVDIVQPGVVNIGTVEQGDVDVISQRSVNAIIVRVRVERTEAGALQVFFNGEPIGAPIRPTDGAEADTPLLPALFVTDGGVILNLTEWTVTLR